MNRLKKGVGSQCRTRLHVNNYFRKITIRTVSERLLGGSPSGPGAFPRALGAAAGGSSQGSSEPENLHVTCICNSLLQSSCPACSPLPSCSQTGWAETGGSEHPSHATLLRRGEQAQDEVLGLFLHLGIPRASLEAEPEGKRPTLPWGSPLGVVPRRTTRRRQRQAELVQPEAPKEVCCLPPHPTPAAEAWLLFIQTLPETNGSPAVGPLTGTNHLQNTSNI